MSQEKEISKWLDEYLKQSELKSFIIGVSGGIDSALTSTLCAITGQKTFVVSLPIHQNANQLKMAKNHIEWLKKKYSNVEELYVNCFILHCPFNFIVRFSLFCVTLFSYCRVGFCVNISYVPCITT